MPGRQTIDGWKERNSDFAGQYARAQLALWAHWADEIIEIGDEATTDFITKKGRNGVEYEAVDQEHIQRSRLRCDNRKWLLSKLLPAQYGDHVDVQHGGTVTHEHELSDRELARRLAFFLVQGGDAAGALLEHDPTAGEAEPGDT